MLLDLGGILLEPPPPARGELARCFCSRRPVRPPAAPAQFKIGIVAAEAALGQQHGDVSRPGAEAARAGVEQHVREARLQRKGCDRAAAVRNAPLLVDCAERCQSPARLVQSGSRRRIEERQAGGIGLAPQQAGQQQARQIGLEDLGRIVGRE